MGKRRIAVIGAGMALPPHADSLLELAERVEVAGVFSRERERLDRVTARYDFPVTDALEPLLADRSIDAVMILTPPQVTLKVMPGPDGKPAIAQLVTFTMQNVKVKGS